MTKSFAAYVVRKSASGEIHGQIEQISLAELPAGDVTIRVRYSSLNYKDALAAQGHPGVVRKFPHVPGIDAVGEVVQSENSQWQPGQHVLVTGYELGAGQWGGWSEYVRVPAAWVVALPDGLSPRVAMIYGTAGFTAAQCVDQLQRHDVSTAGDPLIVSGATGGVGSLSVKMLSQLGYVVHAATGKAEASDWLKQLGAQQIVPRDALSAADDKPMRSIVWGGGVDTVGGQTLVNILKQTQVLGCVTACGMVGGTDLNTTVYPFILRGVSLVGITSSLCPYDKRKEIWRKLAGDWRIDELDGLAEEVRLQHVAEAVERIREGKLRGRVVVSVSSH